MPVVAVGFAVALDVGAGVALAAGTLTTLAAITAIGATVSAVGAVTHNKTLSLVGAGLGIVGAIGTLATGAGVFDNVKDLFGSSSGEMSAADSASLSADETAASNDAIANLPGAINSTSLAGAEGSAAALETAGQTGGALTGALSPGAGAASAADVGGAGAAPAGAGAVPENVAGFNSEVAAASPTGMSAANEAILSNAGLSGASSPVPPSGLMAWANKNPMLAFGAIQAGGSFISGLTNPMTPAQIDALNAQADVNRATAALIQRQTANQNAPLPSASLSPSPVVTGKVEPIGGLINNSPTKSALITGAPYTSAQTTGTAA